MARDQGVRASAARRSRPAPAAPKAVVPAPAVSVAKPAPPRPKTTPAQFIQEVRQETRKITWPSWKETWITSIMVFIMVLVTAMFFLLVDGSFSFLLQQVLKLAG